MPLRGVCGSNGGVEDSSGVEGGAAVADWIGGGLKRDLGRGPN